MLAGSGNDFQSPSASSSMVSRKTAPCRSSAAPGRGASYSAHFRRVLPTSMARKVLAGWAAALMGAFGQSPLDALPQGGGRDDVRAAQW